MSASASFRDDCFWNIGQFLSLQDFARRVLVQGQNPHYGQLGTIDSTKGRERKGQRLEFHGCRPPCIGNTSRAPIVVTSLDHQYDALRELLGLRSEFVIHSLRHTVFAHLGVAGADAFKIVNIAGRRLVPLSLMLRTIGPLAQLVRAADS